jgi:ubiquinone/menaquinone biosynthesis C-methylase UbiE
MQQFPGLRGAVFLDISQTSIQVTMDILETFQIAPSRFKFINGDFLRVSVDAGNFDFITMGEVLEHVNDALGFLQRACNLIKDDGRIFMTTCSNCPAIDHIYHFHNTNEIRDLIHQAGLRIITELSLPAENISEEQCEKELVTINYCAILMKKR